MILITTLDVKTEEGGEDVAKTAGTKKRSITDVRSVATKSTDKAKPKASKNPKKQDQGEDKSDDSGEDLDTAPRKKMK